MSASKAAVYTGYVVRCEICYQNVELPPFVDTATIFKCPYCGSTIQLSADLQASLTGSPAQTPSHAPSQGALPPQGTLPPQASLMGSSSQTPSPARSQGALSPRPARTSPPAPKASSAPKSLSVRPSPPARPASPPGLPAVLYLVGQISLVIGVIIYIATWFFLTSSAAHNHWIDWGFATFPLLAAAIAIAIVIRKNRPSA